MSDKPAFIGIDLGNAYSRAAHARYSDQQGRYGEAQVICPAAGRPYVRSILACGLDDEQELGDEVFVSGAAAARPETVRRITKAGLVSNAVLQDDVVVILVELRKAIEKVLGPDGVTAATVVVGVDRDDGEDGANGNVYYGVLLDALSRAGFSHAEFVPEGLAAFAFHRQRGDLPPSPDPGRYLVFDFGADHTNCTVIDVIAGQLPVVASVATDRYGGSEFDAAIAAWVLRCFAKTSSRSATDPELLLFAETLKQAYCERLKSGKTYVEQFCELSGINTTVRLTQEDFNSPELARNLQAECLGVIMKLLREIGVKVTEPKGIILAGGGARWGFIEQQVRGAFPDLRYLLIAEAPEETVVKGLAIVKTVEEPVQVIQAQKEFRAQPGNVSRSQIAISAEEAKPANLKVQRSSKPAVRQQQPQRRLSPRVVGNLELLGWFGLLGIGWICAARPLRGALFLVGWWALIILGVIGATALAITQSPWYLAGALVAWFAVPLLSRSLVRRCVRRLPSLPSPNRAPED